MRSPILCLLAAALALPAGAAQTTLKFRGYAYDLASKRFLYTELHEQTIEGEHWVGGTTEYYAADGTRLGQKTMDFAQSPYLPIYRLDLAARGGYSEAITAISAERVEMARRDYGESEETRRSVRRAKAMAADSGFHTFIRDHFSEIMAGKTVSFVFGVAGNLDAYKFRARRIDEVTFEGRPAVRIKVEPGSLLRWLVDPLELTYEPGMRKLVEYQGASTIRDPATGEAYTVRIIYPSKRPDDAPPLPGTTAR